jgi:hypothetical protein
VSTLTVPAIRERMVVSLVNDSAELIPALGEGLGIEVHRFFPQDAGASFGVGPQSDLKQEDRADGANLNGARDRTARKFIQASRPSISMSPASR